MKKTKFILVSIDDETMAIEHETFDTLEDAQAQMRAEWEEYEPDTEYGDFIEDMAAVVAGKYFYVWQIIKVEF